jgi:diguanylate cyclase (GGDEF)-like protein
MSSPTGKGLRALVVDDEPTILLLLGELLMAEGFLVDSAESIAEANDHIRKGPYDLYVVDKNLPDGTGLSLAARVIGEPGECEVILMSAYSTVSTAIEGMRAGAADFIVKPFDIRDLHARLRRVVSTLTLKRRNRDLVRELREKNDRLQGLVVRDAVTQLFSHAYFQEALEREVLRARRQRADCALALIDIDGFKAINDARGHSVGNEVLKTMAQVVNAYNRRTDIPFLLQDSDIAARYGGDELALVFPDTNKVGAATKAERIRAQIEAHDFSSLGVPRVTVSIGVAAFPEDATDRVDLITAATSALAAARRHKNRVLAYSPELSRSGVLQPAALEAEAARRGALDRTIAGGLWQMLYQPIVDARSWAVFAYEALVRPTEAAVTNPEVLIRTAENAGKIAPLGRALRAGAVSKMHQLAEPCLMFLNLHPQELSDHALLGDSEDYLHPHARRVVFEMTEMAAVKDFERTRDVIARLRERGYRVALDDLGAGYSGLNTLAKIEPEFVKLDMGLLRGIRSSSSTARLIRHLAEFANGEGIQMVAEGIETEEELEVVEQLGCPLMQGYYFARPGLPFVEVRKRG